MKPLTDGEQSLLLAMFTVFAHAAENVIRPIEIDLKRQYEETTEYRTACKKIGEEKTDAIVEKKIKDYVRQKSGTRIGKTLKVLDKMHDSMMHLTMDSITTTAGKTDGRMFDALQGDSNFLCRLYCYIANCTGKDDEIKIESTVKALAKGNSISKDIIELFEVRK